MRRRRRRRRRSYRRDIFVYWRTRAISGAAHQIYTISGITKQQTIIILKFCVFPTSHKLWWISFVSTVAFFFFFFETIYDVIIKKTADDNVHVPPSFLYHIRATMVASVRPIKRVILLYIFIIKIIDKFRYIFYICTAVKNESQENKLNLNVFKSKECAPWIYFDRVNALVDTARYLSRARCNSEVYYCVCAAKEIIWFTRGSGGA